MNDKLDKPLNFLERWSQRKQAAKAPFTPDAPKNVQLPTPSPPITSRPLTDADMPPLASLTHESDYSVFFSPQVSEELRHLALRKLFQQPELNITDGLEVHGEDYTQFAPLGEIVTHEMKRELAHLSEQVAQQVEEQLEQFEQPLTDANLKAPKA